MRYGDIAKKVQAMKPVGRAYPLNFVNTFNVGDQRGECIGIEIVIGGDKYKLLTDKEGKYFLTRYNPKYKMWVDIRFSGSYEDIQSTIINILQRQFIDRVIKNSRG